MKTTMTREEAEKMVPYVLLQRCSVEEINSYKPRNSIYSTDSNSDQLVKNDESSPDTVSLRNGGQRVFHSYVLLERLPRNVIDTLLINTRPENTSEE